MPFQGCCPVRLLYLCSACIEADAEKSIIISRWRLPRPDPSAYAPGVQARESRISPRHLVEVGTRARITPDVHEKDAAAKEGRGPGRRDRQRRRGIFNRCRSLSVPLCCFAEYVVLILQYCTEKLNPPKKILSKKIPPEKPPGNLPQFIQKNLEKCSKIIPKTSKKCPRNPPKIPKKSI